MTPDDVIVGHDDASSSLTAVFPRGDLSRMSCSVCVG